MFDSDMKAGINASSTSNDKRNSNATLQLTRKQKSIGSRNEANRSA